MTYGRVDLNAIPLFHEDTTFVFPALVDPRFDEPALMWFGMAFLKSTFTAPVFLIRLKSRPDCNRVFLYIYHWVDGIGDHLPGVYILGHRRTACMGCVKLYRIDSPLFKDKIYILGFTSNLALFKGLVTLQH